MPTRKSLGPKMKPELRLTVGTKPSHRLQQGNQSLVVEGQHHHQRSTRCLTRPNTQSRNGRGVEVWVSRCFPLVACYSTAMRERERPHKPPKPPISRELKLKRQCQPVVTLHVHLLRGARGGGQALLDPQVRTIDELYSLLFSSLLYSSLLFLFRVCCSLFS